MASIQAVQSIEVVRSWILERVGSEGITKDVSMHGPTKHPSIRPAAKQPRLGWYLLFGVLISVPAVAEEEEVKPVPVKPPAAKQPWLGGAVRDLLNGGRGRGMKPMAPKGGNDSDGGSASGLRDPVDDRAPHDSKVEQFLKTAEGAVRRKDWKLAVELFQRLLDQPEDSLHRSPQGQWQSVRRTVNQGLGQLPEGTLAEYRSQYGGLAQQQLLVAKRSGQPADYVNVATRFFHTPAGYEAAHYLAALHFDRSEFGLAARWFDELATSPAELTRQDPWLMQAALAFERAGDQTKAKTMLDRLSQGRTTVVELGTGAVSATDWLKMVVGDRPVHQLALAEWTQLYGTAARVGTAVGGDALLSPNWSIPLTSSNTVSNMAKWLVQDLQDQQRSLILAACPLVVGGKVIYRDLRGMRSVDIERGTTLWESVEGVSPDRILGGLPPQQIDPQEAWRFRANPFQTIGEYHGAAAEHSPLTSLLFRDGIYGLISTDGRQVFVIEDHGILSMRQPGQHWGWDGSSEPQDPYGVPWKTNRLISYDLQTGRTLWSLGGSESRESFDLPLAGSYFYGTPAIDGDELFVIAGKGDEIRLWSIDRRTGLPRWSQLIAYADTKIDLDIARRWVTAQVAVRNGVIVCPTTVGWLIAIDRMRQSVLWAHRYTARSSNISGERELGSQILPQRELNGQWSPSAPIIAGNCVVYTPQEEPLLICLNVVDGRRLWEQPKGKGLYLAGVFDQHVVIVGETNVSAFNLSNGQSTWVSTFEQGTLPSGRGVAVDDRFYLPLNTGELRAIQLSTGKLLTQTYVGPQQPSLGNLAMHQGKLVSLSPSGLTAFGQRDALLAEIQQRLTKSPHDHWALLRSGEIQLLNHQYGEALELLRRTPTDQMLPDERVRHHKAMVECLSTLIHQDVLKHGEKLEELRQLAQSPVEKLLHQELLAEQMLAEKNPLAAFEVFAKLAEEASDSFVVRTDDRHVSAQRPVWLSGRMFDIWSSLPDADRLLIDANISQRLEAATRRDASVCQRTVTLYSFHPSAIEAKQRLVELLVAAKDLSGARVVLQQLAESSVPAVAARAYDRLAQLMKEGQLFADAVYYYRRLESDFADVVVRDGLTGAALAAEARAAKELDFASPRQSGLWDERPLHLVQSSGKVDGQSYEAVHETPLPFFDSLSIEAYPSDQRIAFESVTNGRMNWIVPLRSAVRGNDEGHLVTRHIGHQVYFVNRGILHAISPLEKQILWSKTLNDLGESVTVGQTSSRRTITTMTLPGQDNSQSLLLQESHVSGRLAIVQPNYLCVYGRRSLSILDPRTGNELWTLDGLAAEAQVVGHCDTLFVIVPGKEESLAYRALDGKPLQIPGISKLLNKTLLTHGSSLLLLEKAGNKPLLNLGLKRQKILLKLHDPIAMVTKWQLELPAGTRVSPIGQDELVASLSDGQMQRIDVATGRVTPMESVPQLKGEKYLIADNERIYQIVNWLDNNHETYSENLATIPMNGTIHAWSRSDHRLLWKKEIKKQFLIVDRFSTMPVLLFVARPWKPNVGTLAISALHKNSGQQLIDVQIPSAYSGFHGVNINAEEPSIELTSYNIRIRLVP